MEQASQMPWPPGEAPATWDEVKWPDWVPQRWIDQIVNFWGPANRRTPLDYERGMRHTGSIVPPFGHVGWFRELISDDVLVHGRYIHAWNNIGRLVDDNGEPRYVSSQEYEAPAPPPPPPPKWRGVCPLVTARN